MFQLIVRFGEKMMMHREEVKEDRARVDVQFWGSAIVLRVKAQSGGRT